jgi:prevent-host-death family protein
MRSTAVKFSEDVVPLGEMKVNPGKIVRRVDETGRPVLLTSHGRGVAVLQALDEYEAVQEERDFMRAVVAGLADIEAGRVMPLDEVVRSLGLE